MAEVWEVLVPTVRNDGRPFRLRYHRVWDRKVREITGGLTIMPVAKGQWISPAGELFLERVIPVRIACTREQAERIVDMTLIYYDQLAVLAYRVADDVILRERQLGTCDRLHGSEVLCGPCDRDFPGWRDA